MNVKSFIYCAGLALTLFFTPPVSQAEIRLGAGALFTMDNATDGNHVLGYSRAADGTLSFVGEFATGGVGSGAGLRPGSADGLPILGKGRSYLTELGVNVVALSVDNEETALAFTAPPNASDTINTSRRKANPNGV